MHVLVRAYAYKIDFHIPVCYGKLNCTCSYLYLQSADHELFTVVSNSSVYRPGYSTAVTSQAEF